MQDNWKTKALIFLSSQILSLFGSSVVSTLVLAIYFLMGHESITLIFIISAIRSVGPGIQTLAVGAILPQIVPMEKMTRINEINNALTSVMMLLSPAVAGIFFATLGFGYTLLLDAVTAALAVGILSFLKVRTYQRKVKVGDENLKEGTLSELKAGLCILLLTPFIWRTKVEGVALVTSDSTVHK